MVPSSFSALITLWKGMVRNNLARIIWKIWKWRNEVIFDGVHPDWDLASNLIKFRVAIWARNHTKLKSYSVNEIVYNLHSVFGES